MPYCPLVLVAMETHFHVFTLNCPYFKKFPKGTLFKIKFYNMFFLTICSVKISLVWRLLEIITGQSHIVTLPSNGYTSNILTEHSVGKLLQILFYTIFLQKTFQNIDNLA